MKAIGWVVTCAEVKVPARVMVDVAVNGGAEKILKLVKRGRGPL